jgi:glutathione S-transferase
MAELNLTVLSLRYSSWSMRPWLVLSHAGAAFETITVELESFETTTLAERRALGSVSGLFPILRVDGTAIHESLAIAEYAAEAFPDSALWPESGLERARARAICSEMVSNFSAMRNEMSCHLFGRAPSFVPSQPARRNIDRVFEIWSECLDRSGGPFLYGDPTIADFFYFPVLTRFRTYGIEIPGTLEPYAKAVDGLPAVGALIAKASSEPTLAIYDDYILKLGGDPNAALPLNE